MDAVIQVPMEAVLPKYILDIWVIVPIILATIVIMTSLLLCPATAVILYCTQTHPVLTGAVRESPKRGSEGCGWCPLPQPLPSQKSEGTGFAVWTPELDV
ncbi:small integral membrane protein 3-like [Crocuta crocuta]